MVKKIFSVKVFIPILIAILLGCATNSKPVKPLSVQPSSDDQAIIEAGIKKAKELGLRPFPMIGEGKGGQFTVISPAQITYDKNGNWITTSEDLYINATQGNIVLKSLTIKRGQYAREVNYQLKIVE